MIYRRFNGKRTAPVICAPQLANIVEVDIPGDKLVELTELKN